MEIIFLIIIFLIVAFAIMQKAQKQNIRKKINYEYELKDSFFTKTEQNFLKFLKNIIKNKDVEIYGQTRLADIIKVKKGLDNSKRTTLFNKIKSKHFDYVLVDKNNYSVICVIELQDKSHNKKTSKINDEFKKNVCEIVGLELVEIWNKKNYNENEVLEKFSNNTLEKITLNNK
jgi:hypothetical protein